MRYRIGQKIIVKACCVEKNCGLRGKKGIFGGYNLFSNDLCNLVVDGIEETAIRVKVIRPVHTICSVIKRCK